jgi:phosphoglycolate phosphatase
VIGLGLKAAQSDLFPGRDPNDSKFYKKFHLAYRRHFDAGESQLILYTGALELFQDLRAAGRTIAVATAKSRAGIDRALVTTGLSDFVTASRTPEECRPKPDPHMIEEILVATGVSADRAVMIGDTTHDLQMGINAGVSTIGLSHGAHAPEALTKLRPIAVCADLFVLKDTLRSTGTLA